MASIFGRMSNESPAHDVVRKVEKDGYTYEIRKYPKSLTAEVTSDDIGVTGSAFSSEGFKVIARYIGVFSQAENSTKESIPMTAPVVTYPVGSGEELATPVFTIEEYKRQTLCFYIPKKYTLESIPSPVDPRIKIKEVPPRCEAVYTYSGSASMENCGPEVKKLYERLHGDGVHLKEGGSWHLDRYNPPFTIPWFRTNEIHIPVECD
jgi:hypothetical protein